MGCCKMSTLQRNNSGHLNGNVTTDQEKCYDPQDTSLTFVDGEDDLDFLCSDFKSLRAKMSCGHTVTPMSLTDWCRRLLDKGECRFVCGQPDCDVEWPFQEVCKMALLTPEEKKNFEEKMLSNAADDLDIKVCPGCKSHVSRPDLNDLCVLCTVCKAARRRYYRFCWQCLREWKGPAPRSDRCGNDGCVNQPLELLKTCPDIVFEDVEGVNGCPSIRACPTCGLLLEHNKTQCKNIVCPRCKVEFCFVCLKLTAECVELAADLEELSEDSEIEDSESDIKESLELQESVTEESETKDSQELHGENTEEKVEVGQESMECQESITEEDMELSELLIRLREDLKELQETFNDLEDSDSEDSEEEEEEELSPYYILCSGGVAPRQTSIPEWQRK